VKESQLKSGHFVESVFHFSPKKLTLVDHSHGAAREIQLQKLREPGEAGGHDDERIIGEDEDLQVHKTSKLHRESADLVGRQIHSPQRCEQSNLRRKL